jgi:hypothetical protein
MDSLTGRHLQLDFDLDHQPQELHYEFEYLSSSVYIFALHLCYNIFYLLGCVSSNLCC